MAENTKAAELAKMLQADGYATFRNYRTGGNCEALLVQRPGGGEAHALITDGDHREPWEMSTWADEAVDPEDARMWRDADEARTVLIGLYQHADDDVPAERTLTDATPADVAQALREMFGAAK